MDDKVCVIPLLAPPPWYRTLWTLDPAQLKSMGAWGELLVQEIKKQMYELFASSVCSPACGSLSSNKKEHGVVLTDSYDAHAASS